MHTRLLSCRTRLSNLRDSTRMRHSLRCASCRSQSVANQRSASTLTRVEVSEPSIRYLVDQLGGQAQSSFRPSGQIVDTAIDTIKYNPNARTSVQSQARSQS